MQGQNRFAFSPNKAPAFQFSSLQQPPIGTTQSPQPVNSTLPWLQFGTTQSPQLGSSKLQGPQLGTPQSPQLGSSQQGPQFGTLQSTQFGSSIPQCSQFGTPQSPQFGSPQPQGPQFGTPQLPQFGNSQPQGSQFGTPQLTQFGNSQPQGSQFGTPQLPQFGNSQPQGSQLGTPQSPQFGSSQPQGTQLGIPQSLQFGSSKPQWPQFGTPQSLQFGSSQQQGPQFGTPQSPQIGSSQPQWPQFGTPQSPQFGSYQPQGSQLGTPQLPQIGSSQPQLPLFGTPQSLQFGTSQPQGPQFGTPQSSHFGISQPQGSQFCSPQSQLLQYGAPQLKQFETPQSPQIMNPGIQNTQPSINYHPKTVSFSDVMGKYPNLVFSNNANIKNNLQTNPQLQQLLPSGILLDQGGHSQSAIDFLMRNVNIQQDNKIMTIGKNSFDNGIGLRLDDFRVSGENEKVSKYLTPANNYKFLDEYLPEPYQFGIPDLTSNNRYRNFRYNKNAVANHLKKALYNVTPTSKRYQDIKTALLMEDSLVTGGAGRYQGFNIPISSSAPPSSFDSFCKERAFYNNNLRKPEPEPRKRYYSKLPNSDGYFFRRRDLERMPLDYLHEHDLIEVMDIPNFQNYQQGVFTKNDPYNDNFVVMGNNNNMPQPNSNKSILYNELNQVNHTTLEPVNSWKKLSDTKKTKEILAQELIDIGKNTRSLLDNGSLFRRMRNENENIHQHFQNPFLVPEWRRTGPPTRNDPPDFSELIRSHGIISTPPGHSSANDFYIRPPQQIVGNLPKRLTARDFQDSPKKTCSNSVQVQRTNIGGVEVVELIQQTSTGSQCDTIFQKDWLTVNRIPSAVGFNDTHPNSEQTHTTPRRRQRRARSRMTAGHGFRFKCGITLTNAKYYCRPSINELHSMTDTEGDCFVENFEVGHVEFGNVVFLGEMNVAGLNLDTTVQFFHQEINVYPNPDVAPCIGNGLNRPAIVTLEKIWPKDMVSKEIIKISDEKKFSFENSLRKACDNFKGEFISYDSEIGRWIFKVKHFMD